MTQTTLGLPIPDVLAKRMSVAKVGRIEIRATRIDGLIYDGDIVDGLWYPSDGSMTGVKAAPKMKGVREARRKKAPFGIPNEPWVSAKLYRRALMENARMRTAFATVIEDMGKVRDGVDEVKIEHAIAYANVIANTVVDLDLPGLPEA